MFHFVKYITEDLRSFVVLSSFNNEDDACMQYDAYSERYPHAYVDVFTDEDLAYMTN